MRRSVSVDYEFDWGGRVKSSNAIDQITIPLLECFERSKAKATFFISAETVKSTLPMLREIVAHNHEIASHGFHHDLRYDTLSKEALSDEIRRSKETLEDALGIEVVGFRTPQFRKNRFTEEVLQSLGFTYDSSSVNTSLSGRYQERQYEYGHLPQIPVSTIYGRFPAGIKWMNLLGTKIDPCDIEVIYLHPFDLLSMMQTLKNYSKEISPLVLAFYIARLGSTLGTVEKVSMGSQTIVSILSSESK